MSTSVRIRPASVLQGDDLRLVEFFESQLSWLASIGSSGQWGSEKSSTRLAARQKYYKKIQKSEATASEPWTMQSVKVYIADMLLEDAEQGTETQPPDVTRHTAVAAMILEGRYADHEYAGGILPEQDENDLFIFVTSLVSDRRLYPINRGVGALLLERAKQDAKELGITRVCLDCWRGNGGKLVNYYERKGFIVIGEVGDLEIEQGDKNWPGAILELRL